MSKTNTITPKQKAAFWRAHHAACINLGLSTSEEREEYRKRVMREKTGKEHLAQLSRTKDFDACMRRFASDAGDFETASRFAIADDARKAAILRICCAQVLQLKGCVAGTTEAADYLAGIVEQARVPCGRDVRDSSFWMDCAPGNILALFQILDTHRRRLLRGLLDGRTARTFLGFDPSIVYQPRESGGLGITYDAHAYDSLTSVRIYIRSAAA